MHRHLLWLVALLVAGFIVVTAINTEPGRLGCYEDNGARVWKQWQNTHEKNTVHFCRNMCQDFKFAGMEAGQWCMCGDEIPPKTLPDSRCNSPCSGDSGQTCGGGWALEIFPVDPKPVMIGKPMGCFQDTGDRVWKTGLINLHGNSPQRCFDSCRGFRYAGMEARVWFPYDVKANLIYEINLAVMLVALQSFIFIAVTIFTLLATCLVEAASHLELLCHNLVLLRESALRRTSLRFGLYSETERRGQQTSDVSKEMMLVMRHCVRHHHSVIRFMAQIQAAFGFIITQYLLGCLVPSALTLVAVQHIQKMNVATWVQLMALPWNAIALLLLFKLADNVTSQSELIREAVFGCDWLSASDSFKRSMRIMMTRCNRLIVLEVSWGIQITLDTYRELITNSYKFSRFVSDMKVKPSN